MFVSKVGNTCPTLGQLLSEDFSLLVAFLLVTFSWLFRGFFVALFCLEKQCLGLFRGFFVVFSWLFRGFFVAPVLGKIYAYSPWNSLLLLASRILYALLVRKRQGKILHTELLKSWSTLGQLFADSASHGKLQRTSLQ